MPLIRFLSLILCLLVLFLTGCGSSDSGNKGDVSRKEEEKRKWVFWQMEKPEIQLDPVEEEEYPAVIAPMNDD